MEISFTPNDRGQVGIGTLIVFIAMVLVAAIAAGVLINTAGFLQTQAEDTGTESTEQVANNLNVITEVGAVAEDSDEDTIEEVLIGVQPAAGSDDLNLEELSIQYVSDESFSNLVHVKDSDIDGEGTVFNTQAVTAEDGTDNVMTDNADRYEIVIPLDNERPFVEDGLELAESGETLAVDLDAGDENDIVDAEDEDADRLVAADVFAPDDFDTQEIADAFDGVDEDQVVQLEIDGEDTQEFQDVEDDELDDAELLVAADATDDADLDSVDEFAFAPNGNAGFDVADRQYDDGDNVQRFVIYVEEVDPEELEGFDAADEEEWDVDEEFYNNLDNDNLANLVEGEEAELTYTTETGAQTVTILQVPDSLAGEDGGDTVDL